MLLLKYANKPDREREMSNNKKILILSIFVLLAGYDSDPLRRKMFDDNRFRVVIDIESNTKWIVSHKFGDNYNLHECDKKLPKQLCEIK